MDNSETTSCVGGGGDVVTHHTRRTRRKRLPERTTRCTLDVYDKEPGLGSGVGLFLTALMADTNLPLAGGTTSASADICQPTRALGTGTQTNH